MRVAVIGAWNRGVDLRVGTSQAGVDVEVFEREDIVGGRMSTRARNGLDFDLGAI